MIYRHYIIIDEENNVTDYFSDWTGRGRDHEDKILVAENTERHWLVDQMPSGGLPIKYYYTWENGQITQNEVEQ